MNLWLEAIAATTFAFTGVIVGYSFSRLPKPYWAFGYFIPLALVLAYGVGIHFPELSFTPPISWMTIGRRKFAIMGFIAAMVLTTPLFRLPRQRDRAVVFILMAAIVFVSSTWPFLAPAFNRNQLAHLRTRVGGDGVCLQDTDYTCGPAAAVTALRKLGLPAEEGKIAILSCTSSTTGTSPDLLAEALQNEYGKDGLMVEYRPFKDISELKQAGLTLAVVRFSFMVDHWVAVLGVSDSEVIIGDPISGLRKMSFEDFSQEWRYVGIVLKRKS